MIWDNNELPVNKLPLHIFIRDASETARAEVERLRAAAAKQETAEKKRVGALWEQLESAEAGLRDSQVWLWLSELNPCPPVWGSTAVSLSACKRAHPHPHTSMLRIVLYGSPLSCPFGPNHLFHAPPVTCMRALYRILSRMSLLWRQRTASRLLKEAEAARSESEAARAEVARLKAEGSRQEGALATATAATRQAQQQLGDAQRRLELQEEQACISHASRQRLEVCSGTLACVLPLACHIGTQTCHIVSKSNPPPCVNAAAPDPKPTFTA